MRPSQRFAINGYDPADLLTQALHPPEKTLLKLLRIDVGKDAAKGIMRGNAIGQFSKRFQPFFFGQAPCFDVDPAFGSTDHR